MNTKFCDCEYLDGFMKGPCQNRATCIFENKQFCELHFNKVMNLQGTTPHELTQQEHSELVQYLCKSGAIILNDMTPHGMHLLHMTSKLSSEAGELIDAIGKLCFYNQQLDVANVVEELGDMEFYMEGLRNKLGISREQTLAANIVKLRTRYPSGFSDKSAQERKDKA